jgi:small GTP-binding protein
MKKIRCVLVGDGKVGKTSLLMTYTCNCWPGDYIPPVFEDYFSNVTIEDEVVQLQLCDTSGQQDYKKLRVLAYPQTDVFIFVFSLVKPASLNNIQNMWVPEVKEYSPNTPYILVGLKSDLRDAIAENPTEGNDEEPVPQSKGKAMANAINAQAYFECSAKMQINVKDAFEQVAKAALHQHVAPPGKRHKNKDGGCEVF